MELATPEQAGKLGSCDDRHATVVGGLEILVPRHKILWWGDRGEQIKKEAILLVANHGRGGTGNHQIGVQPQLRKKRVGRDRRVGQVPADGGASEYLRQFRYGGLAHHGHNLTRSERIEDLGRWATHGHQPRDEDIGIKNDAHARLAPRLLRR